jgi:hypothetical protein
MEMASVHHCFKLSNIVELMVQLRLWQAFYAGACPATCTRPLHASFTEL